MPSSISTPRAAIIGATSARGLDALAQDRAMRRAARLRRAGQDGCRRRSLLWSRRRLLQSSARPGIRVRAPAESAAASLSTTRPALAGRCSLAEKRQRVVLIEARATRASARAKRARAESEMPDAAARARREIPVVEEVAHAAQEAIRARRAPGIPRVVASTMMRVRRRCPARFATRNAGLPLRAMARAQVVDVARVDAAARRRDRERRRRCAACGSLMQRAETLSASFR